MHSKFMFLGILGQTETEKINGSTYKQVSYLLVFIPTKFTLPNIQNSTRIFCP